MTILIIGCWQDHAIIAADSLGGMLSPGSDKVGRGNLHNKLHVFPTSSIVAAGRGMGEVVEALLCKCREPARHLDELAISVPAIFAPVIQWAASNPAFANLPVDPTEAELAMIGWSRKSECMTAHVFTQLRCDSLVHKKIGPGCAWFGPWIEEMGPEPGLDEIATDEGIISVAKRQDDIGAVAGGPLVVARLERSRIILEPIADLG